LRLFVLGLRQPRSDKVIIVDLNRAFLCAQFMIQSIELQVNGETCTCLQQTNLPQLLVQMGLNPRLLAVEYNGEILHRQFWEETEIRADDRLEIVTIVGGG
jgi:sulfur carrier protein